MEKGPLVGVTESGDGGPILTGRANPLPAINSHCSSHNTEYHTE
jgi:hypothetical protein